MADLRDEILKLTNPAPVFNDPEDNLEDETSAKLVDQTVDEYEDISEPSTLRRKTAIILGDTDHRYVGQKTSRKSLDTEITSESESGRESDDDDDDKLDDNDNGISDDYDDNDNAEDDEDFNKKFRDFGTKEFEFKVDGDYGKYADDDDDGGSIDGQDDNDEDDSMDGQDDDDDDDDDDDKEIASEDEGIKKFSRTAKDEVAKGQAAKEQLGLWDVLLEGRIKLQKAVSIINQLPQTDNYTDYSDASETFADEAGKAQQAVQHLLGSLVHLQDLLLNQNSETKYLLDDKTTTSSKKMRTAVVDDDDDEEIQSDSEGEMEAEDVKPQTVCRKRKLKLGEYPGFLKKRHEGFQQYRNATIQKWFDKTRLAAGKMKGKSFSAFDQSAVIQINQILADKARLIRRTQLKRTVYRVLGTTPRPEQAEILPTQQGEEVTDKEHEKEHDEEVFDDDDFYHQLLRELIEKKTSDVSDPVALSRQWLEIQKLRSKNKKKVDTRASKGRKVRYDVHKKLSNFMAPVDCCAWSHEARDDLFKSLFGKRFSNMNQISS